MAANYYPARQTPTAVAITFLQSALEPHSQMRERLGELFAEKCPQYYALSMRERPAFILDTLPTMLRAFLASALFVNDLRPETLPFTAEPLPLPEVTEADDLSMVAFLVGVAESWTAAIDAHHLYQVLGQDFQSLVDPLQVNYKYGPFLDTATLEHANYLVAHPELIAYIRSDAQPRYYSNLVWDTYIDRFPKDAKRPVREPSSRLIEENLHAIVSAAGMHPTVDSIEAL